MNTYKVEFNTAPDDSHMLEIVERWSSAESKDGILILPNGVQLYSMMGVLFLEGTEGRKISFNRWAVRKVLAATTSEENVTSEVEAWPGGPEES